MTFIEVEGSLGHLVCDHPVQADVSWCDARSEPWRRYMGADLPDGWTLVTPTWTPAQGGRVEPGREQHLCPEHSGG